MNNVGFYIDCRGLSKITFPGNKLAKPFSLMHFYILWKQLKNIFLNKNNIFE